VPHEIAAKPTRRRPMSIEATVYGSGDGEPLGFIGLGKMGAPMAGRLLARGHRLVVHDAVPAAGEPLLARGAKWAPSPAVVAREARTIMTIVPSSREVSALAHGDEGLLAGLQRGALVVEMTSADPSATRALAVEVVARGAALIDAPVSGGVIGATAGTLAIMVGGDAGLLARVRPILEVMGDKIFHAGPVGAGHAIKLVNNACSAAALAMTIEAVAVATRAGLDPARAVEIIQASSGRSNATETKFPRFILNGRFDAGFAIRLMAKDLAGYERLAEETGVGARFGAAAAALYREALERGLAESDHTAIAKLIEERTGTRLRAGSGGA
jgi:3-hydroxyisobutyrate dehydrogenase